MTTLRPNYRRPQPSDWGLGMTVCVAAFNVMGELAVATDQMLSMGDGAFTAESAAIKEESLHADWSVLFSADDVGVIPSLLRRIDSGLGSWATVIDAGKMSRVVTDAYQKERLERAVEMYLAPNGFITLEHFRANGITAMGETGAAILRERIEQHRLRCDLLVVGHDGPVGGKQRPAHILHASDPGIVKQYDVPGYWAIGSGAYSALSALAQRGHSLRQQLARLIYNVCEAKFTAESAFGVGRATFVLIRDSHRKWACLDDAALITVRKEWESVGKPRPLSGPTYDYIKEWIKNTKWVADEAPPTLSVSEMSNLSSPPTVVTPEQKGPMTSGG